MVILQIEHTVLNYAGWKKAFDDDPIGRQRAGVRYYRILQPIDDPNYVLIELEFDSVEEAEALETALHNLWGRIVGTVIENPQSRIVEMVEGKEY